MIIKRNSTQLDVMEVGVNTCYSYYVNILMSANPQGMVGECQSGVGRGICVLDGVVIVKAEGAVVAVNLGCPIVTMGNLLHSCVEVRETIELSFGFIGFPKIQSSSRSMFGFARNWQKSNM